jgi:peptidoglycan/xylan/chitin deacetylase (PgdA/CDA1 family)
VRRGVDAVLARPLGSVRSTGATDRVALTFDDGPDPEVTPLLLDVLEELEAPSTFYLLLAQCRQWPDLARAVAEAGHEIALHGVDHRRITGMGGTEAEHYLRAARDELSRLVGQPISFYRPPYGAQSVRSFRAARRAGLTVTVWSADAEDWVDRPAEEVVAAALARLRPGGILLLHERLEPDPLRGAPVTTFDRCAVVREVVAGSRRRGWEPATVGAMVRQGGPRLSAWFRP